METTSTTTALLPVRLVINCGADLRGCVEDALIAAIRAGTTVLPEEIADLFTLTLFTADDGRPAGAVDFAD